MEIKLDLNIKELVGNYQDRLNRAKNMQPVMDVYAEDMVTLIDDSFEETVSPLGEIWDPLSPTTIALRRKGSGGAPDRPLVDTGQLRGAVDAKPLIEEGEMGIEFGVGGDPATYAGTHQFGQTDRDESLPFGGADIPARPFLPASIKGGERKPDFDKGEAAVFYKRWIAAVRVWILEGRLE